MFWAVAACWIIATADLATLSSVPLGGAQQLAALALLLVFPVGATLSLVALRRPPRFSDTDEVRSLKRIFYLASLLVLGWATAMTAFVGLALTIGGV